MFDTLNRRMLPPYGCKDVHAPNFRRLAERSATFDTSYVGSMPCMPARRELHTGRINFLHRSWGPLEPFDDSMPQMLKECGVHTHLVSDHYHYWEDGGCTYHQRYSTWDLVRGQEADKWIPMVNGPEPSGFIGQFRKQDYINRMFMDTEEKQPQTITFDKGLEFLEMNRDKDKWFLHLETFDPHEPFHTMQHYKDLYPDNYTGSHFDWPKYGPVSENKETVAHLLREYKALVSMCDANLGKVLDFMDKYHMWKDTLLIVNTDHGFMLSEHEWWGKCSMPFYNEIAHTPLFIHDPRVPEADGSRRKALVQTIDLCPTLLEFFGVEFTKDMEGKPLRSVLENDRQIHEAVLYGVHGNQVNVTDGKYVYMRACKTPDNKPLYEYTLMPTHIQRLFSVDELKTAELADPFSFTKGCKVLKTESKGYLAVSGGNLTCVLPSEALAGGGKNAEIFRTALYDIEDDPQQLRPLNDGTIEAKMKDLLVRLMRQNDAPAEQFIRLGLN